MTKQLLTLAYVASTLFMLQSCSRGTSYTDDSSGPGSLTASIERPKTAAELRAELLARSSAPQRNTCK